MLPKCATRGIERPTIIGSPSEVRDIIAEYADAGVDEIIIPDFTLGERKQKIATMDLFMSKVADR